mgnify:CR=1 FL=1
MIVKRQKSWPSKRKSVIELTFTIHTKDGWFKKLTDEQTQAKLRELVDAGITLVDVTRD